MHSLLSAIGFEKIKGLDEEAELTKLMIQNLSHKNLLRINEKTALGEAFFEVAENCGVVMRGECTDNNQLIIEHYFPTYLSEIVSLEAPVTANKRMDSDAYTIMTDDDRLGITLIFYLQNKNDMLSATDVDSKTKKRVVYLSALAYEGKILLPAMHAHVPTPIPVVADNKNLPVDIDENDENSDQLKLDMESWVLEDFDRYTAMQTRVENEDIYSIIDTSFIPYGSESDNYSIIGYIKNVKSLKNKFSGESMYVLDLLCNDVPMSVCINAKNLLGEPTVGRRFKGNVWLQGTVDWR